MASFCNIDYPLNIVCKIGWKLALIFVIGFFIWYILHTKNKEK